MNPKDAAQTVNAMLGIQLPGTVDAADVPEEIQWAPPGEHTISASRGGKPVTITVIVDEAAAEAVAACYRSHLAAAVRNEEDLVYTDFNHDDQEASGWVTGIRWAGPDPQFGGIRARMQWSAKGREAIGGRTYRRFSPSFYTDANGRISGAPVNFGGLVNRAAFKRIAPIISKATELAVVASDQSFEEKAEVLARARNLKPHEAVEVLARERPDLYLEYRISLGLGDSRQNKRDLLEAREASQRRSSVESDQFMIESKALAEALEIDLVRAATEICRVRPALYERYRARLFGLDLDRETVSAVTARAEASPFFTTAKAVAAARGIDLTNAFAIVAREHPELYDAYHRNL